MMTSTYFFKRLPHEYLLDLLQIETDVNLIELKSLFLEKS